MGGDDDVVELMVIAEQHIARPHQIVADDDRERAANEAHDNREADIERADVLVVGRGEPARPEAERGRAVAAAMRGFVTLGVCSV